MAAQAPRWVALSEEGTDWAAAAASGNNGRSGDGPNQPVATGRTAGREVVCLAGLGWFQKGTLRLANKGPTCARSSQQTPTITPLKNTDRSLKLGEGNENSRKTLT